MDRCNNVLSDDKSVTSSLSRRRKCRRKVIEDDSSDGNITDASETELASTMKRWNGAPNEYATPPLCSRWRRRRKVIEDDESDDTGVSGPALLITGKSDRKVIKNGRRGLMVGYSGTSSESDNNTNTRSSSSTEVAEVECKKKRRRLQSRVLDSNGEVEKYLPGLKNNVAPQKLSSGEESEDVAIMSGPKTRLLRRTIHDRDSDSSSTTKADSNAVIVSPSPRLSLLKTMSSQKTKRLLKDTSVQSGDECDSGASLDEFIDGEDNSEVEDDLEGSEEEEELEDSSDNVIEVDDDENDEGEVSINYMALNFQLQQDEGQRISGDVEMMTFETAFPQYLQFLCLALDPRLEAGQQGGKTKGEKFMGRWPLDMHKPDLKHLAAASSKVESDIQYRMKNLQSCAWNPSFVNSIQSYPSMEIRFKPYQKDEGYCCSACNHVKHGAHKLCILSGPVYDGASVWDSKRWDRYLPEGWDVNANAIKCFQGDTTSENVELEVVSYHPLYHYKTHLVIRTLQQLRKPNGLLIPGQKLTSKHKWVKKEQKLLTKLIRGANERWLCREWEENHQISVAKAGSNVQGSSDSETFQQD